MNSNQFNLISCCYKSTLIDIINKIEQNKMKFVILIDEDTKVKDIIVDGDIRRLIINGNSLKTSIQINSTKNIEYLFLESSFFDICGKFRSDKIDFLPILDKKMKLVNVITKKQFHIMLLENIEFDLTFDFTTLDNYKLEHEIYSRPWGFYKSTILTSHAQAKIITIFPKSELSLQEHKKREEHWVIIKGKGVVILGESKIDVYPGKYIYIPKGCKHQIINNSNENIIFSEVQLGEYFGEDDIIRYSDKYGRVK